MLLLGFWVATTIVMGSMALRLYVFRRREESVDKDEFGMLALCLIFSPIMMLVVMYIAITEKYQREARLKSRVILGNHNLLLDQNYLTGNYDYEHDKLIKNVSKLSNKELEYLMKIHKDVLDIPAVVRTAMAHEIIDRKLFDNE